MYPILFKIGSVTIYSHGLLVIVGVIIASYFLWYLAKLANLVRENLIDNISSVIIAGIIGARLFYAILYYKELTSFWQVFYIWQGGLVSWGGFLFGALVFILLIRAQKQPLLRWLDLFSISALLGIAIGRVGCALTGDIFARSTATFPSGVPVAWFESASVLILFIALVFIYFRFPKLKSGVIFLEAIAGYSLIRFVLDYFRDAPGVLLGLNSGQITAAVVLVLSLGVFAREIVTRRKHG